MTTTGSICAACGELATSDESCGACGQSPLLDGRYRLDAIIGRGGSGVTFAATRLADNERLCVKELAFHRLASLEAERLFRREAKVLKQLDHPQIPAYIDELVAGTGRSMALYLVQAFVDGHNLASEMKQNRYTEREVLEIADELLGILEYLQQLRPQVTHRDIKPSNIMRRRSDGRLMLVDFGSVRRLEGESSGAGDTIAGTYGYMAPEQFRGAAMLQTDLYGVGALMLALSSGQDPADLVDDEHRLRWHSAVNDRVLPDILEALLQRRPTDRPANATAARLMVKEALAALDPPAMAPEAQGSREEGRHAPQPQQLGLPNAGVICDDGNDDPHSVARLFLANNKTPAAPRASNLWGICGILSLVMMGVVTIFPVSGTAWTFALIAWASWGIVHLIERP